MKNNSLTSNKTLEPEPEEKSPVITDSKTYEEGAIAELKCDGVPENTRVKWKKLDGEMDEYFARRIYVRLYLYYVKYSDAGIFACYDTDGRELKRIKLNVAMKTEEPWRTRYTYSTRTSTSTTTSLITTNRPIETASTSKLFAIYDNLIIILLKKKTYFKRSNQCKAINWNVTCKSWFNY